MRINEIETVLTFRTENFGYHHGQSDQRLVASRGGVDVGYIDYADYGGEPNVKFISVPTERRQGIGTALVKRLQSEYPGIEINMGGTTDMGHSLLGSIPQTVTQNAEYAKLADRLERLRRQENEYTILANRFYERPTPELQQQIHAISTDWNEINDEIYQIEQQMREMRPATRLYATESI